MASAKQLAALKKGREARAKKLGKKVPIKKVAKKRVKSAIKKIYMYTVLVTTNERRRGYLTDAGTFDTSITKAALFNRLNAEQNARRIFKVYNDAVIQVEVVARKVPAKK